ncbi:MAG: hypothetical protein IT328_27010 [Caldilineaceae bacterium]|nr:hypothetical protein [Caldilineaceae bacterium]
MTTASTESIDPAVPAYPPVTPLRAGPLSLLFSNGDLRQLRVGDKEIVQRIYVAVRDQNWATAPVDLRDVMIDDYGSHFRISFTAIHRQNVGQQDEIGFTWQGAIRGDTDGSLEFVMDGRADTTFRRNRIGFCVLHPASIAGAAVTLEHSDGSRSASQFPTLISPHQPFMDLVAMTHEVAPGLQAEVSFAGDIFETEDQRNWTDASYKTYSTPLSIPYPVTIEAGTPVRQSISVRIIGDLPADVVGGTVTPPVTVTVEERTVATLPALGLGSASHGQPLSKNEASHLRDLNLAHLRVDLELGKSDFRATLERATADAAAINAALEIALFVGEAAASELAALQSAFHAVQPKVAHWLVFARYTNITPPELMESARPILHELAPNAPIGGGTNLYFVHLNRTHPPIEVLDFVSYSINPQVHAFDLVSLVENMTAQPATVASARAFCGDRPISISPITLRARFNADAAGPEASPAPGQLPDAVDVRQPTGFAAAWTLGSLSNLAQAGVASLTYYETTGWRGVMETEQGSPLPDQFPSQPGMLFPIYDLFAALAPYAGGNVHSVTLSDPQHVAAISVARGNQQCTIIGNLRDSNQRVALHGLQGSFTLRTLGDRKGSIHFDQEQTPVWVDLAPYGLVSLEYNKV